MEEYKGYIGRKNNLPNLNFDRREQKFGYVAFNFLVRGIRTFHLGTFKSSVLLQLSYILGTGLWTIIMTVSSILIFCLFQSLVYFYYFIPFYIAAICSLLYPNQHWIKDWSILHAGASSQAQLVYISCSFHWMTAEQFRVPDDLVARTIFFTINVSLWVMPHLFAIYCNWEGLTIFLNEEVAPRLKSFGREKTLVDGVADGQLSFSKIPTRKGPVTRSKKSQKLQWCSDKMTKYYFHSLQIVI